MSCIVGIVSHNEVWIGADSLGTTEDGDVKLRNCNKIFRNGEYLISFAGSVRGGQILFPKYFKPPKDIWDFPDSLRVQCERKGCLGIAESQVSIQACNYLIGFQGKLYEISMDFQMSEITDYASIGAGSPYAYGALHALDSLKDELYNLTPVQRIKKALMAACEFHTSTGEPIYVEKL